MGSEMVQAILCQNHKNLRHSHIQRCKSQCLTGHISKRSEKQHDIWRSAATGERVQTHYNTQLLSTFYLH